MGVTRRRQHAAGERPPEEPALEDIKPHPPKDTLKMFTAGEEHRNQTCAKIGEVRNVIKAGMEGKSFPLERIDAMQIIAGEMLTNVAGHPEYYTTNAFSAEYVVTDEKAALTIKWHPKEDFNFRAKAVEEAAKKAELAKDPKKMLDALMAQGEEIMQAEESAAKSGSKRMGGLHAGIYIVFSEAGYTFDSASGDFKDSKTGDIWETYDPKSKKKTFQVTTYKGKKTGERT
jgi:hypothetical protein